MNQESALTPRGYWVGLKNFKQCHRLFWIYIGLLILWQFIHSEIISGVFHKYFGEDAGLDTPTWYFVRENLHTCFLIAFGSVADWLGTRKTLLLVFIGACSVYGIFYIIWQMTGAVVGSDIYPIIVVAISLFVTFLVVAGYQVLRRSTSNTVRGQAICFKNTLADLPVTLLVVPYVLFTTQKPWMKLTPHSALPIAMSLLTVGAILVFKYVKSEPLLDPDAGTSSASTDHTDGPFSGMKELFTKSFTWRAMLLVIVIVLVSPVRENLFEIPDLREKMDSSSGTATLFASGMSWLVTVLFIPIIWRFNLSRMIKVCTLLILVGVVLMMVPASGSVMVVLLSIAWLLIESCQSLLMIRYLDYVLRLVPIGREGSLAAILAIGWLSGNLLNLGISSLIKSQRYLPWTFAFRDILNPEAAHFHALWIIVLVPVLLGVLILFRFQKVIFGEE